VAAPSGRAPRAPYRRCADGNKRPDRCEPARTPMRAGPSAPNDFPPRAACTIGSTALAGEEDLRLPVVSANLPRHTDGLNAKRSLGVPSSADAPVDDHREGGGNALPRSSNVGCDFASASYFGEATTPQTVAVSPMWRAASSGLRAPPDRRSSGRRHGGHVAA
jgi:hypothetical protein